MKKLVTILLVSLASVGMVSIVNYAAERELNDQEKAAFITRDEFNIWQEQFIASLSALDLESTSKIYADMDFYDMQYRFTKRYTDDPRYWDKDSDEPTPLLEQMILEEKAKRGLL